MDFRMAQIVSMRIKKWIFLLESQGDYMQHLKTEKCVICGNTAKMWHGYVIAKDKMALGNYIDKKVIAGFCDKHSEILCSGQDGNYGCYNSELMGKCIPLFNS